MDTFIHGALGALCFARSGLPAVATAWRARRRAADAPDLPSLAPAPPFYRDRTCYLAVLFGMMPDLASIGPTVIVSVLRSILTGVHHPSAPSPLAMEFYHANHSILGILAIALLLRLISKKFFFPAFFAWPLHVLCDIPTHPAERWGTPLLWPFSLVAYDGSPWWVHRQLVQCAWAAVIALWLLAIILPPLLRLFSRPKKST